MSSLQKLYLDSSDDELISEDTIVDYDKADNIIFDEEDTIVKESVLEVMQEIYTDVETEMRKHFISLACDKTVSLFAVITCLYEDFVSVDQNDKTTFRTELLNEIKSTNIENSRYKLIEIVIKNFFT